MEKLLGLALIDRSSRGSQLTPAGTLVVDWAREVIDAATSLEQGVSALRAQQQGQLRVAASMTVAEYLLPNWLVTAHRESNSVRIALTLANSTDVAISVLNGSADLGFVEGPSLSKGLRGRTVARDRLEIVVAPSHRWATRRRPIDAAELAATPLIQREPGSGTRYTLSHALERFSPVPPLLELSSTTAIKSTVASGLAPAVISSLAVAIDLAERRLVSVPVSGVDLHRRLRVVWATSRKLVGPSRDFVGLVSRGSSRRTAPTQAGGEA